MVDCVRPEPLRTIAEPACGTGGFFLVAYDYIVQAHANMDKEQKQFLKFNTFAGNTSLRPSPAKPEREALPGGWPS